jgi:hypothetical protein
MTVTTTVLPGAVPFAEFYNGAINAEDFNVQEDFRRWKSVRLTGV